MNQLETTVASIPAAEPEKAASAGRWAAFTIASPLSSRPAQTPSGIRRSAAISAFADKIELYSDPECSFRTTERRREYMPLFALPCRGTLLRLRQSRTELKTVQECTNRNVASFFAPVGKRLNSI